MVETEANVVVTLCSNYHKVRQALPQQIPVITVKMHVSKYFCYEFRKGILFSVHIFKNQTY